MPGNPAEDIDALRIRKAKEARDDFKHGVRHQVLKVVDVRLDEYPPGSGRRRVVFMKRELHVCFAKLDLLVTASSSFMQDVWIFLFGERSL